MAELLVHRGGKHRWDKMTSAELATERLTAKDGTAVFDRRYNRRYLEGQVVEIHEDGFWSTKGDYPRRDMFRVVLVPGVKKADLEYLTAVGATKKRTHRVLSGQRQDVCSVDKLETEQIDTERVLPD